MIPVQQLPMAHRSRLLLSMAVGLIVGFIVGLSKTDTSLVLRAIVSWDIGIAFYMVMAMFVLARFDSPEVLKQSAAREDQSRLTILVLMSFAAFASLIAIGTLLSNTKSLPPETVHFHLILGAVTVFASWTLTHMLFAVHYAHCYYGDLDDDPNTYQARQGLQFPGHQEPGFSDFLYYALVVGMTCQVSDVQVTNSAMRRLTLTHGVLAFFFNTIVLALSVNIGASLIS